MKALVGVVSFAYLSLIHTVRAKEYKGLAHSATNTLTNFRAHYFSVK